MKRLKHWLRFLRTKHRKATFNYDEFEITDFDHCPVIPWLENGEVANESLIK